MLPSKHNFKPSKKLPLLFVGHGSPMYAIQTNEFTQNLTKIAKTIPTPQAILLISAHWVTDGTCVTAMDEPRTIYDFYGFPKALYNVKYPAKGSIELATLVKKSIQDQSVFLDSSWGLDHGAWTILKYLYPKANIPVVQLSLNKNLTPSSHYNLAKSLYSLRKKGILIIGSGNIVHNLRYLSPHETYAHAWAKEAHMSIKKHIKEKNHAPLINFSQQGNAYNLSIPTSEHFLPLLYILALQDENDSIDFFNDSIVNGAIAMTTILANSKE